jgi:undecaprenyl-diphosphatase
MCLTCFILLAVAASQGWTKDLDERILRALRKPDDTAAPVGPAWVEPAAKALAALGSGVFLIPATAAAAALLFGASRRPAAWRLIAAGIGGFVLSEGMKLLVGRPRPSCVPHLEPVASPSFPSSHAMLSAAVYLTIAVIVAGTLRSRAKRAGVAALAAAITLLVGFTRTVLGVHYPTDVLGGWAGGLTWMLLCWIAAGRLERRGPLANA